MEDADKVAIRPAHPRYCIIGFGMLGGVRETVLNFKFHQIGSMLSELWRSKITLPILCLFAY